MRKSNFATARFLAIGLATGTAIAQTQSSWTNGALNDNDWSASENWNPQMTPNNDDMDTYAVTMDAATTNLSENITISSAIFGQGSAGGTKINGNGQTFNVDGPVTIDVFTLGGEFPLTGMGTFDVIGATSIARTFRIDGDWNANLADVTLGTASSNGLIDIPISGELNVDSNFTFVRDGVVRSGNSPTARFTLDGNMMKTGGTGLATVNIPFTLESGSITVSSGSLQFDDTVDMLSTLNTSGNSVLRFTHIVDAVSTIQVSDTSAVEFSGAVIQNSTLSGSGSGDSHIRADNGTDINDSSLEFTTASHPFEFDGDLLNGVTNDGFMTWGRGEITGTGLTNSANATLETVNGAAGTPEIDLATLANEGTLKIGAQLDILANGKINHNNGEIMFDGSGGINARNGGETSGLITQIAPMSMHGVQPTSRATIAAPINSSGNISVTRGELQFNNTNDDKIRFTGPMVSVDAANGNNAKFSIGANNSSKSDTFDITFVLSNGGIAQWFRGMHKVAGTISALGNGIARNDGATMITDAGQAVSFSTSETTPFVMNSTNATLQADGAMSNSGFLNWISGAITGPAPSTTTGSNGDGAFQNTENGTILVPGVLRISRGVGTGNDRGGTLSNDGEIRLTNGIFEGIAIDANGRLNNNANGVVNIFSDQDIGAPVGGTAGMIDNQGAITKKSGNSDSLIAVNYEQSGDGKLRAESGMLRVIGDSIMYMGGTLEADGANSRLETDESSTAENVDFKLTNDGVVDFGRSSGTVIHEIAGTLGTAENSGAGSVLLSGGATMRPRDISAILEITGNAAFRQIAGTLGAENKGVENQGNAELAGGEIVGDYINRASGSFLLDGGTVRADLYNNLGTFQWDSGTLDTQITNGMNATFDLSADNDVLLASNSTFTNNGTVDHTGDGDMELGENAQLINNADAEYIFTGAGRISRVASIIENAMFTNMGEIRNDGDDAAAIDVKFTSTNGTIRTKGDGDLSINGLIGEQDGEPIIDGGALHGGFFDDTGELRTLFAKLRGEIDHVVDDLSLIEHTSPELACDFRCFGDGTTVIKGGNTPDGGGDVGIAFVNDTATLEFQNTIELGSDCIATGNGLVRFRDTKLDLFHNNDLGRFLAGSNVEFFSTSNGGRVILRGPDSGDRQTFFYNINEGRKAQLVGGADLVFDGNVEYQNNGVFEIFALGAGMEQVNAATDVLFDNRTTGTFRKAEDESIGLSLISVPFINCGTVHASEGQLAFTVCQTLDGGELEKGTWIVEDGASLQMNNGAASPIETSNATITLRGDWSFINMRDDVTHDFLNDDDGVLNLEQGAEYAVRGEYENDGVTNIDATSHLIVDTLNNSGTMNVGGRLSFAQDSTFFAGTISGTGIVNGTTLSSSANTAPGNSPGELTINADFNQLPAGSMTMELAGLTPGSEHDLLTINGALTLAGTLDAQLLSGFEPMSTDTFTIVTAASITGGFDNAPNVGGVGSLTTPDGDFTVNYNATSIVLSDFVPAGDLVGDMNCDGAVTVGDIGGFVLALTDPAGYAAQFPDCDINNADVNDDGAVTVGDIGPFVALLTGG